MSNAQEETLRQIAGTGPVSSPTTIITSQALPAASAALVGTAFPIPAGCAHVTITVTYALGSGASSGAAIATVVAGFAASPLYPVYAEPFGNGAVTGGVAAPGAVFSVPLPPGVTHVTISLAETGDPTHPGTVSATIRSA